MSRSRSVHVRYAEELRVFPNPVSRVFVGLGVLAIVLAPYLISTVWLQTLSICGCFAIGALGLNLLTGYTGQVSLGNAFFLAVGGYTAGHIGASSPVPWPIWLAFVGVLGAIIGLAIGPFALRLQGNYLAIVTIALLYVSQYLWARWTWFTGGGLGLQPNPSLKIGPINFAHLAGIGLPRRDQGVFLLIWITVIVVAVLSKNIVRARPGRAMQAVRDRDVAAEAIGVSLVRYKEMAFGVSSAFAAISGALYFGVVLRTISPEQVTGSLGLILSIQFVAAIIIGGIGTIHGGIVGALFVGALPTLVERNIAPHLSFIGEGKTLSVAAFSNFVFGALIIVFLLLEPLGVAALWRRCKAYVLTWPFSY
jgi:branched-chain amino acid transport system permease protein